MKLNAHLFSILLLSSLTSLVNALPDAENILIKSSINFNSIKFDQYQMSYAYSGDVNNKGIIFIHGTPGSWQAFSSYLEDSDLQKKFFMVSVDRLGWGKSSKIHKKFDGDFNLQVKAIVKVIQYYPDIKWTVVGHSLGASIAPKVMMSAGSQLNAGLLLAGTIDPNLGKPRWYNRIANTWLVKKLLPMELKTSNNEIMKLRQELTSMSSELAPLNLEVPLMVIQGKKDKLVSPKNPNYISHTWRDNFSNVEILILPESGHFIPWEHADLVAKSIKKLNQ